MSNDDLRICFIGDSFVNGTNDPHCLGWAGRLATSVRRKGYALTYYNLGVRRETSADIAVRWQNEVAPRFPANCIPRLVFSFGTNDTMLDGGTVRVAVAASVEHTQQILRAAKALCPVLMIGPPPVADAEHNERIARLSQSFAATAKHEGVPFLSVFETLLHDEIWMREVAAGDGSHPAAEGYTRLAALVGGWQHWWFR